MCEKATIEYDKYQNELRKKEHEQSIEELEDDIKKLMPDE